MSRTRKKSEEKERAQQRHNPAVFFIAMKPETNTTIFCRLATR